MSYLRYDDVTILHYSHPHCLKLMLCPYPTGRFKCDACGLGNQSGYVYHCKECSFDLHAICASKPPVIAPMFHPHHLSLRFFSPHYPLGFSCDVCKQNGYGADHWLYRCDACNFDAHLECATKVSANVPHISCPGASINNAQVGQQNFGGGRGLVSGAANGIVNGVFSSVAQVAVRTVIGLYHPNTTSDGHGGDDDSHTFSSFLTDIFN